MVDDWIPIQIGVPYRGQIPFAFTTQQLRVYLPIQDSCKALHIRLTQHSGTSHIYIHTLHHPQPPLTCLQVTRICTSPTI